MRLVLPISLLLAFFAPAALAQDGGGTCEAGQPAAGLSEVAATVETLAAPQSFDIGHATQVRARDLQGQGELHATCYDDGDSCPGGCDAHVVANNATNGTARYHAPGSTPGNWQDCRRGQDCEVCFGDDPADCITVTHRGTGPDAGRADFTAAFWAELCALDNLPDTLDDECDRIEDGSDDLRAVSCLEDPDAEGCEGVAPTDAEIAATRQAVADCLAERNNSWRCYYQGPNGTLSPGACENGAVNSSGWDCCSGDRFHDACVTGCSRYYVDAPEGGGDQQGGSEDGGAVEGEAGTETTGVVEPSVEEPATEEPVVAEPVVEEPVVAQPVVDERPRWVPPADRPPRWPFRRRRPRPRW